MKTLKSYWYLVFLVLLIPVTVHASGEKIVVVSFSEADISSVYSENNDLFWIKLSEDAREKLKSKTQESYGADFKVDIEGVTVLESRIYAIIESGIIRVDNPSDDVRRFLEKYIRKSIPENKASKSE